MTRKGDKLGSRGGTKLARKHNGWVHGTNC
jgi:hypothetical protein